MFPFCHSLFFTHPFCLLYLLVYFQHSSKEIFLTKFYWAFKSSFWMFFSQDTCNILVHNIIVCFTVQYLYFYCICLLFLYKCTYYLRRNLANNHTTRKFHTIFMREESDVVLRGYKKQWEIGTVVIQNYILGLYKYESIPWQIKT